MKSPFLVGERLYLRSLEEADLGAGAEYVGWLNDREVTRYMGTGKFPVTEASVRRYLERFQGSTANVILAIVDKETDQHIGNVTLNHIDWIDRRADTGILIGRKEFWGKGYAFEAWSLLLDYAFRTLGLRRIVAGAFAEHASSIRILEKLGFRLEGKLRRHHFVQGEYHDAVRMGLLSEEFYRCRDRWVHTATPKPRRSFFFETITHGHRPLVSWALARGDRVFVFDFTYQLKSMPWLRDLIHEGRVERIYIHPGSRAFGLAIDAAEWLYDRVSGHPLIRRMGRLVGLEEANPIFKFSLAEGLTRYFYMRLFLDHMREAQGPSFQAVLVPEQFCMWDDLMREWCQSRFRSLRGVDIPRWARFWSAMMRERRKCVQYLPVYLRCWAYGALGGLFRRFARRPAPQPLRYRVAYEINSQFQTKFTEGRRFDFLLDHRWITKGNTVFVVGEWGDGSWLQKAREAGYRTVRKADYSRLRGFLKNPPFTLNVPSTLRTAWEGTFRIGAPEWLHRATSTGLWILVSETNLLERISCDHYVYTNQYRFWPRWRNVLVRRTGAESWCFAYSNGGCFSYQEGGPFASDTDFGGRHLFWAYENADHLVSPSQQLIDYHRRHPQRIREYHDVGNPWSEQILETQERLDRRSVLEGWFGPLAGGRKIVAWFDTSFVEGIPNSPSTYTEAIQWYSDILRLAQQRDDLLMVIKPSKGEIYYIDETGYWQWSVPSLGRKLMEVWGELKRHPRVRFLEHSTDPSTVVAVSDLTVTFCYTAVSAEALGARKRAIWYEPGERWRDTVYGREPLLVAHGYAELSALLQKLLFEMSDEEYQAYLDRTVRGLVETFLDGKGLSRFRALLAGERFEEGPQAAADYAEARR